MKFSKSLMNFSAQKATGIDDKSDKYLKYGEKGISKQLKIIKDKSFDFLNFLICGKLQRLFRFSNLAIRKKRITTGQFLYYVLFQR